MVIQEFINIILRIFVEVLWFAHRIIMLKSNLSIIPFYIVYICWRILLSFTMIRPEILLLFIYSLNLSSLSFNEWKLSHYLIYCLSKVLFDSIDQNIFELVFLVNKFIVSFNFSFLVHYIC